MNQWYKLHSFIYIYISIPVSSCFQSSSQNFGLCSETYLLAHFYHKSQVTRVIPDLVAVKLI